MLSGNHEAAVQRVRQSLDHARSLPRYLDDPYLPDRRQLLVRPPCLSLGFRVYCSHIPSCFFGL